MTQSPKPRLSGTTLIHGDADVTSGREVAPSISVSTTFRYGPDEKLSELDVWDPTHHVYSRYTQETNTKVEHIISKIAQGYALTYASGLAAAYAALVHLKPTRVAIRGGYFGCHASLAVYRKSQNVELIDIDDDFRAGDACWLETPLNPTGESRDIQYYADKIHKVGGSLLVDSTFAPPPLQYPFKFGADCVLHSGTKYFGGHSDLLSGVLVVKTKEEWTSLQHDRTYLGSMIGSLEAWLLLRSLRTLHIRVARQSENATKLVSWLKQLELTPDGQTFDGIPGGTITKVWHSSLQGKDSRGFDPKKQMEGGWNPTFAIQLSNVEYARYLPHSLEYFIPATSLGGVESLIEHRARADEQEDPRLVRISVGAEDIEDLISDLKKGLQNVVKTKAKL